MWRFNTLNLIIGTKFLSLLPPCEASGASRIWNSSDILFRLLLMAIRHNLLFWTFWTFFRAVLIQRAVGLHIFNLVPWTWKSNRKMCLVVSQLLKSPPLILDLMSWDDDYWIVGVLVIFVYWEKISDCWANICVVVFSVSHHKTFSAKLNNGCCNGLNWCN